jgi:hypothetical protein
MKIIETLAQCSHCQTIFRAPIHFGDVRSFENNEVGPNSGICSKCGKSTVVDKAHMAYRLEDGSIGGKGTHFKP